MSQLLVLLGFVLVLGVFVCVGLSARRWSRASTDDYLLTGRQTHPWLVGFAAAATNSSGFMFIGLIGATMQEGISAGWLMFGWIIGDYPAWLTIHRRLRECSGELNVSSISEFVASGPAGSLCFGTYGVARLLGYPVPVNPDVSFIAPDVREAGKS